MYGIQNWYMGYQISTEISGNKEMKNVCMYMVG